MRRLVPDRGPSTRTNVLSITLTYALSLSLFFASLGTQTPDETLPRAITWRRNIRQDSIHLGVRSTFLHFTFSPTPPDPQNLLSTQNFYP